METVLFINTGRVFEIVTETDIQVRLPKEDDHFIPLILAFRILYKPKICVGVIYSQWLGCFHPFLYFVDVSQYRKYGSDNIRGYCIF